MKQYRWHLAFVVVALFVFVVALLVISKGTTQLQPTLNGLFHRGIHSAPSALGGGWLAASFLLNGSAVAATALALLNAGIVGSVNTFMLIGGSRLGGSFVVILLGFIGFLTGSSEQFGESLTVGILSFLVTFTIYCPAIVLGWVVLELGWTDLLYIYLPDWLHGSLFWAFEPLADLVIDYTGPSWGVGVGFLLLVGSFQLFDRTLKQIDHGLLAPLFLEFSRTPFYSFLVGASLTVLTASIAFSIGILVPLYAAGLLNRRGIIPYVLGANVTTLMDTLLAGLVLNNPVGVSLVLWLIVIAAIVCIPYLIAFENYADALRCTMDYLTGQNRRLAVFLMVVGMVPVGLLFM